MEWSSGQTKKNALRTSTGTLQWIRSSIQKNKYFLTALLGWWYRAQQEQNKMVAWLWTPSDAMHLSLYWTKCFLPFLSRTSILFWSYPIIECVGYTGKRDQTRFPRHIYERKIHIENMRRIFKHKLAEVKRCSLRVGSPIRCSILLSWISRCYCRTRGTRLAWLSRWWDDMATWSAIWKSDSCRAYCFTTHPKRYYRSLYFIQITLVNTLFQTLLVSRRFRSLGILLQGTCPWCIFLVNMLMRNLERLTRTKTLLKKQHPCDPSREI